MKQEINVLRCMFGQVTVSTDPQGISETNVVINTLGRSVKIREYEVKVLAAPGRSFFSRATDALLLDPIACGYGKCSSSLKLRSRAALVHDEKANLSIAQDMISLRKRAAVANLAFIVLCCWRAMTSPEESLWLCALYIVGVLGALAYSGRRDEALVRRYAPVSCD